MSTTGLPLHKNKGREEKKGFWRTLRDIPRELRNMDSFAPEHYRVLAAGLILLVLVMVIAGSIAFLLALRGTEQTIVPDVRGLELSQAIIALQDKELSPRLALRFTDNPGERGKVTEVSPAPGTMVKAGRRVTLTVSRGPIVDKVQSYIGQNVKVVSAKLEGGGSLSGTSPSGAGLSAVLNIYNPAKPGTILEQKPEPGKALGLDDRLVFVVSRGPKPLQP